MTRQSDPTPLMDAMAKYFSHSLACDARRGIREAASRGFWVKSHAPYGYRKKHVRDGSRKRVKLIIDPAASEAVRRMFEIAVEGMSDAHIVATLNHEGISTRSGKRWTRRAVQAVLADDAYAGTCVSGATTVDGAPLFRVEGACPAIVTQEEFDLAQQRPNGR